MTIDIEITQANLDHQHIYLAKHRDFFPADAIGESNLSAGEGRLLKLHVDGLAETIQTDIAGDKMIFRQRAWVRDFFNVHSAQAGDLVQITKIAEYNYQISLRRT